MHYDKIQRDWGTDCRYYTDTAAGSIEVPVGTSDSEMDILVAQAIERDMRPPEIAQEPQASELSIIDKALQDAKNALKAFGAGYIKQNPTCTYDEYMGAFDASFPMEDALIARKLLVLYMDGAVRAGAIMSADFILFRDLIVATPVEILMEML